jgi:hypothetical protein
MVVTGPIHKLKAITTAMNSDQTTDTTQNPDHTHLKAYSVCEYIYIYITPPPSTVLLKPTIPILYNISNVSGCSTSRMILTQENTSTESKSYDGSTSVAFGCSKWPSCWLKSLLFLCLIKIHATKRCLKSGAKCGWVRNFVPQLLHPQVQAPQTHWAPG